MFDSEVIYLTNKLNVIVNIVLVYFSAERRSATNFPYIHNHLVHEPMYNLFIMWISCIFNPLVSYIELQIYSQLVLSFHWVLWRSFWLFSLQGLFGSCTNINIIFYQNSIIILLWTCNVWINFLSFIFVSTCTVIFKLHISIAQVHPSVQTNSQLYWVYHQYVWFCSCLNFSLGKITLILQ